MGLLKKFAKAVGWDLAVIKNYHHLPAFRRQRAEWLRQGGKITRKFMILGDYEDSAGTAKGHYFHQDLLVAGFVHASNPERHVDVGSRIDGFVAHVASFRPIEVFDVRPLPPTAHKNIVFRQADLMGECVTEITDSLSCLHTIEHFGLGRYGDPIDVDGHLKGIANLVAMVKKGGTLYISFPIGRNDEVHFNAHRVFHPTSILSYDVVRNSLALQRFDYVDDAGDLHLDVDLATNVPSVRYGCGIYTFRKQG
ncbi:DUF268 domain-containing protein [Rhizobium sp. NTR19]|uniref:DUF268 domain-containing protein n=1 Tax=Neorhizobium turbinariae TaxID=2937795 RepID=A0ABT0IQV6_9HYPH|nr:DUF268 domain-containing protein [Neorhizobium turbinariae]MCK8780204.1 DUF268 domain-containing protein [Neorhizobium turbinariae]